MALKYREDPNLEFLRGAHHEDLAVLATYLTLDDKKEKRYLQELLDDPLFRASQADYSKAWKSIAAELQKFGGDSAANLFRGHGVLYREILDDVSDRIGVKGTKEEDILKREDQLLACILEKFFANASKKECDELLQAASDEIGRVKNLTKDQLLSLVGTDFRVSLLISSALATAMQRIMIPAAIGAAAEIVGLRLVGAFIPVLALPMLGAWLLTYLSGPAYRVTVPSVVQVCYMRREALADHFGETK